MAIIPLSAYRQWAEDIKVLERRFVALMPWIDLFPKSSAQGKWYQSLLTGHTYGPFSILKSYTEDLSWNQHRAALEALPNSQSRFFHTDPAASLANDACVAHFADRAAQVLAAHSGRGKPKPVYTDADVEFLQTCLFEPTQDLLADMFAAASETHEQSSRRVIAEITKMSRKFATAKARACTTVVAKQ